MTELLATAMRLFNDCSRFYLHADRNKAENLIVGREVAVDSVQSNAESILPLELLVGRIQYLRHRWEMFALREHPCTLLLPLGP